MTFNLNDKVVHVQRGLFEDYSGRTGTVMLRKPNNLYVVEFDEAFETVPGTELELVGGINGAAERK